MTWSAAGSDRAFKRALIISAAGHVILFSFIILNPSLPKKPSPKGVIHYISMGMVGGGGGGRGGGGDGRLPGGGNKAAGGTTAVSQSKPESLRDLTVPEKVVPKTESRLRYPVDDKTKRKAAAEGPPAPPEHLKKVVRERYDWGVITARYLSVYEQAVQNRSKSAP